MKSAKVFLLRTRFEECEDHTHDDIARLLERWGRYVLRRSVASALQRAEMRRNERLCAVDDCVHFDEDDLDGPARDEELNFDDG